MTDTTIMPPASINPLMMAAITPQQFDKTAAASKEFESVFLSQMMSHMFEGVGTDPMFGGGAGEDMFKTVLVQEYGKQMAKTQSIGISDQLQKMMLQMQQR